MSNEYWEERQNEYKKQLEKDEEKLKKRLFKYYDREARKLDKEIASYYSRYGTDNVLEYRNLMEQLSPEDKDLLMQHMDEFAAKYPQYAHLMPVRESIYKLNRLEGLQYSVRMHQLEIGAATQERIEEHLKTQAERGFVTSQKALGLGSEVNSANKDIVRSIIQSKWSNGKSFSERIWDNVEKISNYVNTDIAQGFARGDSYSKLTKQVTERFANVSKSNAYRLIYTEGTYVAAESQARAFEKDFEQYDISPLPNACEICVSAAANGPFRFEDRKSGENYPPFHPWCRCSITVHVDDWDKWIDVTVEAEGLRNKAIEVEPAITRDLQGAVSTGSGKLVGLDYKIKSKESLARKLQTKANAEKSSVQQSARQVTDVLRYTQVSDAKAFVDDYKKTVAMLKNKGYNQIEVKNTFIGSNEPYRGVNTLMQSKDGYIFELQYHTPESLEMKEKNHSLYEEARLDTTSKARKDLLHEQMVVNAQSIVIPDKVDKIEDAENI